jgi:molybdenum cofactor cytidylyltransferase
LAERRTKVGGLVLAAGLARRFGGSKLLATLSGRALVSHVLDAVSVAQSRGLLEGIHVVAAEGDDSIADLTRRVGATIVPNPDPSRGLSSSLKLGLAALPETFDAALVFLADQPLVRVEVIASLIDAWQEGGTNVVRPRYARTPDIPGHPVLLARPLWRLAGELEGDAGFGLQFSPGRAGIRVIDVSGDNPDVNTRADLLALEDHHP